MNQEKLHKQLHTIITKTISYYHANYYANIIAIF